MNLSEKQTKWLKSGNANKKHGMRNTKFYFVWGSIKRRCNNNSKYYAKRGIGCLWSSFEEFKNDMYKSYLKHKKNNTTTTIERIDNNGNYCKQNCRWATMKEQNLNKRNNLIFDFKGKQLCLKEISKLTGINYQTLRSRIIRKTWIKRKKTLF